MVVSMRKMFVKTVVTFLQLKLSIEWFDLFDRTL